MVSCLDREFVPKMEAEFLVLVDVLQTPSFVFPIHTADRSQQFDTRLLQRLIRHAKHLLDSSSKSDMCVKLIQIFRQMLSLETAKISDKQVSKQELLTILMKNNSLKTYFFCGF